MPTQYTIRNIPPETDRYYRKRAALSGKSLNQVLIDKLNEDIVSASGTIGNSLDWLSGSGMDQATVDALDWLEKEQKRIAIEKLQAEQLNEYDY